ncbi:MAG TPA: FUSC family protein, partial [Acidimicrobiales bacterium]|nr:FUSC family protein [Acidimicrobiales bacterium]
MTAVPRWRALLAETWRLKFDQADLAGALRCTLGVLIPLVVGLATGAVADGLAAAIGAICAGVVSFQGAYRSRVGLTLAVAAGMSLATISGALADKADWSAIVVVGLWGLLAGMMTCLGQGALIVGLQWSVAVIIVNAFPMTTSQAFVRGAVLFAGGALQTLLVVLAWPIRSYASERRAVAAAYQELGDYARHAWALASQTGPDADAAAGLGGVAPTALDAAHSALNDPQPFGRPDRLVAFQSLVNEADRLRLSLASLGRLATGVQAESAREAIAALLGEAAGVLEAVARAVAQDAPLVATPATSRLMATASAARTPLSPRIGPAEAAEPDSAEAAEPESAEAAEPDWILGEADRTAEALLGQLRSALRLVALMNGHGEPPEAAAASEAIETVLPPPRRLDAVRDALVTLHANLSWRAAVFRHAVRLSVTLAIAMVIYRLSGLEHGYWVALTALIVLRPDFNQTLVRGLSRIVGTIVGAGLSTLLVVALKPGHVGLAIMFAAAVLLAFVLLRVNYAAFSVFVTSYVVFLLSFAALPALSTAANRVVATLIGGALATAAYFAWPTWE